MPKSSIAMRTPSALIMVSLAPLLTEISRVLRDKFAWSEDRLQSLALRLTRLTSLVQPTQTINAVPEDPDDN